MTSNQSELQQTLKRWTLFLGVLQITAGCVIGLVPPSAVAWYRGMVMSHIEFVMNGIMMIAFGFLVSELALGARALKVWFATLQMGTWFNGMAGLVGALIGFSSALMPTLNEKFPAPNGPDHPAVTTFLQVCGISILIALVLTLVGLGRKRS